MDTSKVIEFNFLTPLNKEVISSTIDKYLTIFNFKKGELYENLLKVIFQLIKSVYNLNLKKAFFLKNNIIPNSFEEFRKISYDFDNLDLNIKETYQDIVKKEGYNIKIYFGIENNDFIIIVENNTKIDEFEQKEILNTLDIIKKYDYFDQALKNEKNLFLNYGIIVIIMILRKLGLNENFISFCFDNNLIKIKITFPLYNLSINKKEFIIDEILNEIKNIPQFPQHIVQALYILNNPNSNFNDISYIIKKDPALIADILKLVNSSLYSLPQKIASVEESVRIIGIKGLKNLIIAYSTNKIFMNKYNINLIKKIILHSTEVAIYSYELAKKFNLNYIIDSVYVCGMLHDFGKIIINSVNPSIIEKIENICKSRGIDLWTIESLTQGYNHSFIGFKLAEKWNFPSYLKDAILLHHTPWAVNANNKIITYVVYFANILTHYKNKEIPFEDIYKEVIDFFNIEIKENLDFLIEEFYKTYTNFLYSDKILI